MDIRPAATLALLRDGPTGLEVLLLQRSWDAAFLPGYYVFPGGAVDDSDRAGHHHLGNHTRGSYDDTAINQTMSLDGGGADYLIAAIRESFEEAGVLLATDRQGQPLTTDRYQQALRQRQAVCRGELDFARLCQDLALSLPLDRLAYLSHWVTPAGAPRRFDTRFFLARAPAQAARHDGAETIDHLWLDPHLALADHRRGDRLFSAPTLKTLRELCAFASADDAIAYARANPPAASNDRAWPARKGDRTIMVESGTPAYDQVRKLDPGRLGHASATIEPGELVAIGDGVYRLTAGNPSVMTGPGTNSYLLGQPEDYTVIDPGPAQDDHLERLLAVTDGQIRQVLVTHTHLDHSPAAKVLHERTGARLVGYPAPAGASQDAGFQPQSQPRDGDQLATGAGPLKVLHTPGHASNHLCYLLESQGLLFSGDHIMQGSTVVINPPDGDMKAYLTSLARLLEEDLAYIAPGHGFLMGNPAVVIDFLTTHRLSREHKVIQALHHHGPGTLKALTPHAYDDVPAAIHGLAARSLLAHLEKLVADGRVQQQGEIWQLR